MYKTPFYYYDLELLDKTIQAVNENLIGTSYKVHYALKANAEEKVLRIISSSGFGADCVSGNEVLVALKNGFSPDETVLAGVGKTDEEIEIAIANNIHSINCESIEEISVIAEIAASRPVNIALRVNPNINANTLPGITTGTLKDKFGIPSNQIWLALEEVANHSNLKFVGLHFHIGSQIRDLEPYKNLAMEVNQIQSYLRSKKISLPHLNLGGGLGINYTKPLDEPIPDFKSYFDIFTKNLEIIENQKVHFELGRSIVGQSASLISKVLYVKQGPELKFAIIDAGMTDLMRPALYNAFHCIENLTSTQAQETYEVVGPICESTDSFGKTALPKTSRGDFIKIHSAGAYGQVLTSNYNLRDLPKAVYSDQVSLYELLK